MLSSNFQTDCQISTGIRCINCNISISDVTWKQCKICRKFPLCNVCDTYPYNKLEDTVRKKHSQIHENLADKNPITSDCMYSISIADTSIDFGKVTEKFLYVLEEKKIRNDEDMYYVLTKLKHMQNQSLTDGDSELKQQLGSMIIDYHMRAYDRILRILCCDGGGCRGYMSVKVLQHLIQEKYLKDIEKLNPKNLEHKERFHQAQIKFCNSFDYFAGTSTGALIAFSMAVNYNMLDVKDIYIRAPYYFNKNYMGPLFSSKYDPSRLHNVIDQVIESITLKNGKKLSAQNATLLDIHNYLNPDACIPDDVLKTNLTRRSNLLEYLDDDDDTPIITNSSNKCDYVRRQRVLLINSYNATQNRATIFNTSYAKHWGYRIADVLRATMAAPTYFPPQPVSTGIIENGRFISNEVTPEIFIDGGLFANDPELMALWAIRMQWKKLVNYHILSVGTCDYNTPISLSDGTGIIGWMMHDGQLINTLMTATCSLTEIISNNVAKSSTVKRMKFNYKLKTDIAMDNTDFPKIFDKEWDKLKQAEDLKALIYFYDTYIHTDKNS
ncbi:unnamed protein product [Adineta steineri]|uniref:PNPLA domain-containing protein n=1 Tax=Adineta steineri TaxID=433720 RepID=A0A814AWS6_9BILA|nr:unnamed protein product [Adineta steineri]CAF0847147.1 unnamed protein product [Adineta steineri]CAF0920130.1 unnamed protein product [Adineta steineri]